jgi:hypothetical protein
MQPRSSPFRVSVTNVAPVWLSQAAVSAVAFFPSKFPSMLPRAIESSVRPASSNETSPPW